MTILIYVGYFIGAISLTLLILGIGFIAGYSTAEVQHKVLYPKYFNKYRGWSIKDLTDELNSMDKTAVHLSREDYDSFMGRNLTKNYHRCIKMRDKTIEKGG